MGTEDFLKDIYTEKVRDAMRSFGSKKGAVMGSNQLFSKT